MRIMAFSKIYFLLPAFLSFIFSVHYAVALFPQHYKMNLSGFTVLNLPPGIVTVGSITFDNAGIGPYAGTADGRIFRYLSPASSWEEYGYTTPNRNRTLCDGAPLDRYPSCGSTTGLSFKFLTQILYACDAYVGLTVLVRSLGKEASTVVRNLNAQPPLLFPNSVDAAIDGFVYFVDTSAVYGPSQSSISRQTGDSTGRLLRYNPVTRELKTLLAGLGRAVGVCTNVDASWLLVSEANKNRIQKYYLRGKRVGTSEVFLTFEGSPNKIKRNQEGNFWVAVTVIKDGVFLPQGVKFNSLGEVLVTVDLSKEYKQRINTVMQQGRELFVAANNLTYVGRYQIGLG